MCWGGWGNPFQHHYVTALYNACQRHLSLPHEFVCITDKYLMVPEGVRMIRREMPNWEGNLKKLILFEPGFLEGRVLFFDLDMLIVDSIDEMASYDGPFCGIRAFRYPEVWHTGGGMLSFDDRIKDRIWGQIKGRTSYYERTTLGKERMFYRDVLGTPDWWQVLYPDQLVSFKKHCREGVPEGARVVAFHGYPRPHEVHREWVKKHWQ